MQLNKILVFLDLTLLILLYGKSILLRMRLAYHNLRIWILKKENSSLRKKLALKVLQKEQKQVPGHDAFGFWKCEKCQREYLFTNVIEWETLIDRHACVKVPA
jgi:hypothetical protein